MSSESPRPSGSFELYSWLFMRVSGAFIVILVLTHIAFVHFINGVDKINFNFVAGRWLSPTWRTLDFTLLVLATLHGGNGIRILIDDYILAKGWRTASLWALYTVVFFVLTLGGVVMLTFHVPGAK